MGEYAANLTDQKKINKILEKLCVAAYRNLEDENTRVYILNSITKLHASMNFPQNFQIEAVMTDFINSKHIDV